MKHEENFAKYTELQRGILKQLCKFDWLALDWLPQGVTDWLPVRRTRQGYVIATDEHTLFDQYPAKHVQPIGHLLIEEVTNPERHLLGTQVDEYGNPLNSDPQSKIDLRIVTSVAIVFHPMGATLCPREEVPIIQTKQQNNQSKLRFACP